MRRMDTHGVATGGRCWAGESSRCEDPAPTVGIAGIALRPRCNPNAAHCRHHEHTMPHIETCSFYNDAAREGRALGGGQATFGLPLQHLPYRERDGQSDN